MLESLVANLLNRFLGMYVKNFDPKQLNVGIWSGDVKLRNLELRKEALDQLHLPINVVEGRLGELTLSIPWSNLRGKPVKVNIEDVFLLAAPKEEDDYDAEEEEKRTVAVKLEKLESAELLKEQNTEAMSAEEQQKNQSFTQSFTTAIVDNLQVSIKNVHIRYEDSIATPGHPFAVGMTLKEMSAVSTDADWQPTFIQSTSGTTHKLAVLNALGLYWNSDADLFGTGKGGDIGTDAQEIGKDELIRRFREGIEDSSGHQYLLKPVSGRAGIELDKTGQADKPKTKARLLFQELGFIIDEDQYRDALMLVDLMHYFVRHHEYKKNAPKETTKENPRAWIRFAGTAVLDKIQDRNRKWTWDYFKERRDKRRRYIEIFKKKKKEEQKLTEDETKEMTQLENYLSYEDLRFWRSLARSQLRKENVGVKKPAQKQSWASWAWGSKPAEKEDDGEAGMSDEQRKELYQAIDWDEKKTLADAVDLPRETIKLQVESSLRTGSFTLKRDPHGKANEILKLVFDNFQLKGLQRPDSLMADVALGGLRVYDGTTEGSLFPQIVKVKGTVDQSKEETKVDDTQELDDSDSDGDESTEKHQEDDSLFHLVFENNPLDESADTKVDLKLKSLEFIHNPKFVVEIVKFFKPPQRHMESIGALLETAGASLEEIRQQTRAGLEFALEEHKTVNAILDIHAPILIIPESITEESALCMILDAGHVSLNSELVDKDTMRDIHSKQKQEYTDEDYKQLEGLMYDKFHLKLESTQVLIGPGIEATRAQLEAPEDSQNMHIIDRINMDFLLENSIIPKAPDVTKIRISGSLPVLHASISDKKYKNLMRLLDVAIPKFDPPEAPANGKPVESRPQNIAQDKMSKRKSVQLFEAKDIPIRDDDSDAEEESPEKSEGTEAPANLHQRNFEIKFTVEKLQASLYKANPDGKKPDKLLVELVAEHFYFDFYLRPYDMVAEVLLRSLSVDDHIEEEPLPEFKQIISSKGFKAEEGKDLLNVKFVKVNPDSPEFRSTYESIATNLDVSVSTINVIVTRRTLLTLLDFVLTTFTSPEDQPPSQVDQDKDQPGDAQDVFQQSTQPDKIRIKAKLTSIALVLNNDGVRLATLSLNSGDVGIFLDAGAMQIKAKLGSLSLVDDINQGAPEDSPLRRLIAIEGDDLADFKYETFDASRKDYPGYDSGIYLRSGSIKVNFMEEPFRKMMEFGVKFGKMQAIFNAARQAAADQAQQAQQSTQKMHFDIVIKTPIVVFPGTMVDERPRDLLTAYLGEIYASNKFVRVQGQKDGPMVNKLTAGIRHIRLTSEFHYDDGKSQELEMIDKVDLDFKIRYLEHQTGVERPDLDIEGSMSPINLRVSQTQFKFLMGLSKTIPAAFAMEDETEEEIAEELPSSTTEIAKAADPGKSKSPDKEPAKPSSQGPELESGDETWTKLNLVFKAPMISLELILAEEDEPIESLEAASLSKFAINETNVKLRMMSDGALEAELLVHSFTIRDSRTKETNKFRKIMSLINNDVQQQFMASVSISGGDDRHMIVMLTIDSPRVIVALDYVFAVQAFANTALQSIEPPPVSELEDLTEDDDGSPVEEHGEAENNATTGVPETKSDMTMSFRVNIVDAQVILIANPTISNTEAIVLGTKEVLVSKQNATTLQVTKVGMFLCRMDKFETSRLRILDDFSIQTSVDNRSQGKDSSLTSIHVGVEPLVLRLSLRDILLAMQIVSKASSAMPDTKMQEDTEPKKLKEVKASPNAASTKRKSIAGQSTIGQRSKRTKSVSKPSKPQQKPQKQSVVLSRQEMVAQIDGIRVILIGDMHELPMLDWSVKKFDIDVRDWSGSLTADTKIDTFVNVYNFSKSAWEPLFEPWSLGFHMSKQLEPEVLSMELYSHKNMELTITTATIALASKSFTFLSTDEDILSKPRVADAPYRIRNYTGFDLSVWADEKSDSAAAAKLTEGEEFAWRFEDASSMRESLSPEGNAGLVGVKLEGSGFDSITRIPVSREGETLYNLKPKKDGIQHRMLVEVSLGSDNVKYITFRSPLLVENKTQIPIEVGVYSPDDDNLLKIEKIAPGEARPAPVGAAFIHSLVLRPDQGFGYGWSNERLFWKDLLKRSTRTITCASEGKDQSPAFFFQMHASYDKKDPITKVYPYMRIQISAPVEIQNLLPYDFKYRIYDKNTKKDWANFLRKGGVSPVHVVELSHLLLLSVDVEDAPFDKSDFAIINSNTQEDFRREKVLQLKDDRGAQLRLKLHYTNIKDSGGAFRVSVYSPYVLLNQTGLDMSFQSKAFFGSSSKSSTPHGTRSSSGEGKALPMLYSYGTDDRKNRSLLKIGDSTWSKPQSLDAIGSSYEVVLPAASGKSELHAGVSVAEGEGKYSLTKVVTVAPRFMIKNKIGEDIELREPGSSEVWKTKNTDLLPIYFMRQSPEKQLCLCFPGVNNQWSSPFNMANVGMTHIKLARHGQRQKLIRVEIILEDATLFLHLSIESKHWPFSMRNESDTEFLFFQANPNLGEDEEEDKGSGWKPVRYKLPPRSIMPYAWDYPASKNKELVLSAKGKERYVKLAEIGNLIPIKLPPDDRGGPMKVVDVNIVADGPTQTLVLSNYKPSKSLYRQKTNQTTASQTSLNQGFEVKQIESEVNFKAELRLAGFGISLVNSKLKELIYVTFREMDLKYGDSKLYQTVNFTVKWIQIDNQLYGGIFPILLYPSVVPKTGKEMEAHPIFHTMVTRVKDDAYGVLYIKYATLLLQQITVELDEDFIFALLDFMKVPGASWTEEKEGKLCDESLDIPEPTLEQQGQDVYFELLHLQPIQLDLSFVRTERINAEAEDDFVNSPLMFIVNVMTMSIGNVNDAPIRFNALLLENARISIPALMTNIQSHYTQEALRQVHIILGSADFLGNPVGLFNNISSGVADIFYEPYQGLVMTDRPQELGIGIAKGASSFVKKSVFGFSDSMAKVSGSISKGLAAATMDKEFQDQRRMAKNRNRPKHALYGVTAGGNAFAASMASGIGGLARHPLEGAEKEGALGFVKGVGKGFLGLATKPAIGAFDLASNVAEGVRNTTTVFDSEGLDRVRLTRFIGMDGIVRPYSQREALGQFWLKTSNDGKFFNEEYIAHLELEGRDMLVLITYDRLLMIRTKKLLMEWDVKLTDVQTISKERTGMSIGLKGGANGPFIPVTDEGSRNWLYKQIAIAVNAFNDKYNAKG